MKKFVAVLCVIAVLFTLVGCKKGSNKDNAVSKNETANNDAAANEPKIVSLAVTSFFAVALKSDGTVVVSDANGNDYKTTDWQNVKKIVAAPASTYYGSIIAGLKEDGTVYADYYDLLLQDGVADNTHNQEITDRFVEFLKHDNVIDIATRGDSLLALTDNGEVIVTNTNQMASPYNSLSVFENENVVALSVGSSQIVGLKADGTVVADSADVLGEGDVSGWNDIVQVECAGHYTIALKSDGTVIKTDFNSDDPMILESKDAIYNVYGELDFDDWTNIKAVSMSRNHTVGLKADGTVVATGNNEFGQCDVGDWKDIVEIDCCDDATYGLKSDGTVVAVGNVIYSFE